MLPELRGGSADLAGSNNTLINDADSFGPVASSTKEFTANPYGRNLHFGVREHAMAAICNGIALHGGTRPYAGTFLIFSDYMRPAVRLSALMKQPGGLRLDTRLHRPRRGQPTHQPVEHLAALRAIPGLNVVRPADANETVAGWRQALLTTDTPTGLALTRQGVPILQGPDPAGVAKGGYVLAEADGGTPRVILIATGSEVQLAIAARERLQAEGVATGWFPCLVSSGSTPRTQATARRCCLPMCGVGSRSRQASPQPWHRFVGDGGEIVSLEHFGASADHAKLFREFGITTGAVVEAAFRARG